MKKYWLMKSEPITYSIDHLAKEKNGTTSWTGVRNYQARNFMREMQLGDEILFYHSNCEIPGVSGIAKVVALAHPDETQFDKKSSYYEPRATKEKPVWELVDISFVQKFSSFVPLTAMRANSKLSTMVLLQKGSRLSVMPVAANEFEEVLRMTN